MEQHETDYLSTDKISNILVLIFAQSKSPYSDIYIRKKRPIMIRHGSFEWNEFLYQDKVIVPTEAMIQSFMNGIYADDPNCEKVNIPKDHHKLPAVLHAKKMLQENGSIHPALSFGDGEQGHRVRCTIQKQTMGDEIGLMIRIVPPVPQSIHALGLPIQINQMLNKPSGLIVVTGPTGSGKSTSIAAMLEDINKKRTANILTLEDPIEFRYAEKKSMITQREIGADAPSFMKGVLDAMRFVPDVLMVGECRDADTMRAVLRAGESGHLVITSMHAPTSIAAIKKMVALLDGNVADVQALAGCLIGVLAQCLLPGKDGQKKLGFELLNMDSDSMKKALGATDLVWSDVEKAFYTDPLNIPFAKTAHQLVQASAVDAKQVIALPMRDDERRAFLTKS